MNSLPRIGDAPGVWFLVGATATGKSAVAEWIARDRNIDLLSADSMMVYREMDIGTAKPTPEDRKQVNYFGLDLVAPADTFSTGAYVQYARDILRKQMDAGRSTIVVGGTGLYIKGLTQGIADHRPSDLERRRHWQRFQEENGVAALRRELWERAPAWLEQMDDTENPRRLVRALEQVDAGQLEPGKEWTEHPPPVIVGLQVPPDRLAERIARRVSEMFALGLVGEVRRLRDSYPRWSDTARKAIGYREVLDLLEGKVTQQEAEERIVVRTRQFAKRQRTWFRHQARVAWVDVADPPDLAATADRVVEEWRRHGPTSIVT